MCIDFGLRSLSKLETGVEASIKMRVLYPQTFLHLCGCGETWDTEGIFQRLHGE